MAKRPGATTLAAYSYYLAFASGLILLLYTLMGALRIDLGVVSQFVWLALITSAVGLSFSLMARSEFKRRKPANDLAARQARVGLWVNAGALAFMLLLVFVLIFLTFAPGISIS